MHEAHGSLCSVWLTGSVPYWFVFQGCPLEHVCLSENGWNNKTPINCNFTGEHKDKHMVSGCAKFHFSIVILDSSPESGWTKELRISASLRRIFHGPFVCRMAHHFQTYLSLAFPVSSINVCLSEWRLQRWQVNKEPTHMWMGQWWGRLGYPIRKKTTV